MSGTSWRISGGRLNEINEKGAAEVKLAGRAFTIRREFIEDVTAQRLEYRIASLRKALMVMHSPIDQVVGI